jgi:hypothetical protein
MYFLEDKKKKILFGTTAKAGCQHVRVLYSYFVLNKFDVIYENIFNKDVTPINLPENYTDYQIIIFFRNPYERIVSAFKEKYIKNKKNKYKFKNINYLDLTFSDFINDLLINHFKNIDIRHFNLQIKNDNKSIDDKLIEHKNITFFDIKDIDYTFLEQMYKKQITSDVRNFKGGHTYELQLKKSQIQNEFNDYVYDKPAKTYIEYKLLDCYFYNNEFKKKVQAFYKKDFQFAKHFGYNYEIKNYNSCIKNNINEPFSNKYQSDEIRYGRYGLIGLIFICLIIMFYLK